MYIFLKLVKQELFKSISIFSLLFNITFQTKEFEGEIHIKFVRLAYIFIQIILLEVILPTSSYGSR